MLDNPTPTILHVPAGDLHDALTRVKHAISKEETRYYLNGAFLHVVDGKGPVKICATDGHRLAVVTLDAATFDGPAFPGVIIPAEKMAEICKGLGKRSRWLHDVPIEITAANVRLHPYDMPTIECQPIDGTFPDYMRVLPRGTIHDVTLDREALLKGVAAIAGFIKGYSEKSGVAVKFDFHDAELTLSATCDSGGAEYRAPMRDPISAPLQIGFNGLYVLDILKTLEGDTVTLKLTDPGSPVIFAGCDHSDKHALHVLMPMRLMPMAARSRLLR